MKRRIIVIIVAIIILMFVLHTLSLIYMVVHLSNEKQLLVNLSNATKLITWSCTEFSEISMEDITDYSAKEIAEKNDFCHIYRCRFFVSNDSDYDICGIEVFSPDGTVEMSLYPFSLCDGTFMYKHESAEGDDYAYLFTHKPTNNATDILSCLRVSYTFDAYDTPDRIFYKAPTPLELYAHYQPYIELR